jgi:hypothetical protein
MLTSVVQGEENSLITEVFSLCVTVLHMNLINSFSLSHSSPVATKLSQDMFHQVMKSGPHDIA